MNGAILGFAQDAIVLRCGWTLLHFLWQAPIVAAGLAVMLRFVQRPGSRYLCGCAALVVLALLPVATCVRMGPIATTSVSATESQSLPLASNSSLPIANDGSDSESNRQDSRDKAHAPPFGAAALNLTHSASDVAQWIEMFIPALTLCWVTGVFLMGAYLTTACVATAQVVRSAVEHRSKDWQQRISKAAKEMGIWRAVRLLESARVKAPGQIGWLRPIVIVPTSILTNLAPLELDALLLHELAHIRRHDYLVNVLQRIVETLLFYHPVVWWVSQLI